LRHGADLIGGWVYVNYPGRSASPCSSERDSLTERSKPKSKLTFVLLFLLFELQAPIIYLGSAPRFVYFTVSLSVSATACK
jgi:hypothetical protein